MPDKKVAVLIVTWNGWRDAIETLRSVLRCDYRGVRVLLCDNDSPDGSLDRIREWVAGEAPPAALGDDTAAPAPSDPPIAFLQTTRLELERAGERIPDAPLLLVQTGANLGFAGGNNVGLRAILTDPEIEYVWLLNPDTVVEPSGLRAMVALAESDARIGIVGSKVLYHDAPGVIQAIGGGSVIRWQGMTRFLGRGERDEGQWGEPVEPDYITGCSMLVRTGMIREIGLMDESYFLYSEEVDWCIRARRAGWRLVYCPGSTVWHKEGSSVGKGSALADYYSVRNHLLLTRKFYPSLLPLAFLHSLARCLLPKIVRGQPTRFRAVVRGYREFLRVVAADRAHAPSRPPPERGGSERTQ